MVQGNGLAPEQISADGHMTLSVFQRFKTCDLHIVLKVEMENPRGKMFPMGNTNQYSYRSVDLYNNSYQ